MVTCPACKGTDARSSHRRGVLERRLLTWLRVFPFRCVQCGTRFYQFVPSSPRRRGYGSEGTIAAERPRSPRWPMSLNAVVTVSPPSRERAVLTGLAENASLDGVRLQLPIALDVDSEVSVALNEGPPQRGIVRWARFEEGTGFLHGIQFIVPADRRGAFSRPLLYIQARRALRRVLIFLVSITSMVLAMYGLLWLIDAMRSYDPKYYEPKDLERERYELQQQREELRQPQKR